MKLIEECSVLLDPQNVHTSVLRMRQVVMEWLEGGQDDDDNDGGRGKQQCQEAEGKEEVLIPCHVLAV